VAEDQNQAQAIATTGPAKKPLQGIYDPDIDLGYQLKTADATSLGRDYKQLAVNAAREKRLLSSGNQ
jgi:hypothetical protein